MGDTPGWNAYAVAYLQDLQRSGINIWETNDQAMATIENSIVNSRAQTSPWSASRSSPTDIFSFL